jgi:hypothetical protein
MALTGKAIEVNMALRAAAGAVKMMSLSEGVECPYTIPTYTDAQCSGYSEKEREDMQQEDGRAQVRRAIAFLKSIQQGVIPSIRLAALPDDEEKQFLKEIRESMGKYELADKVMYKDAVDWIMEDLFHLPIKKVNDVKEAFANFLRGGTASKKSGFPLFIYDCKQRGYPFSVELSRFIEFLIIPENEIIYAIEKFDRQSIESTFATEAIIGAPKDINNICILIIQQTQAYNEKGAPIELLSVQRVADGSPEAAIFTNIFYIMTNNSINYGGGSSKGKENIYGEHIAKSTLLKHLFERDAVVDIHPWLMYLLSKDSVVMNTAFGGNMTPPAQYPLAFYIVAHYVANQPQYANNPATFYNKSYDDKKPEMLAAIKANEPAVDTLLRDGYAWLGEKYPGMGNIRQMLGDTTTALAVRRGTQLVDSFKSGLGRAAAGLKRVLTRRQKGGSRRITRKASTLQ